MNMARLLGSWLLLLTSCSACGEHRRQDGVEVPAPTPPRPAEEPRSVAYWSASIEHERYLIAEHPDGVIWVRHSFMEDGVTYVQYWRGRPVGDHELSVTRSDGVSQTWKWIRDAESKVLKVHGEPTLLRLQPLTDPVYTSLLRADLFDFR